MTDPAPRVCDTILECIGNTPMVRLQRIAKGIRTPILAKCEFMNPGASVKDRIGVAMIDEAMARGVLAPGDVVVEGTAGNTGVGLALAAALRGMRCIFTMPDKMSREKIRLLQAFGAEVGITPTVPPDHDEYYVTVAKRIAAETPGTFLADQFYNQVNPETHYATTAPEIWQQTEGKIDVLVGGLGTGGTMSGVSKFLKERRPSVRIVGADPVGSQYKVAKETGAPGTGRPYKVEGIGNDRIPDTAWLDYIDEFRSVEDRDSFLTARRLTREEGLFVGGSSGSAVKVALDVARELDDPGKLVVTILTDTGERYLSKLYDDQWMRENGFLD